MIKIRQAKQEELNEIKDLNKRIFINNSLYDNDAMADFAHSKSGDEYFKKAIGNKDGIFYVAVEDGCLIGYVNGENKFMQYRMGHYFEIDNLGVVPEVEGKGVGKILLDMITNWAKEHGFNKIYCSCYVKNVKALGFYKKNNFTEIDLGLEKSI